MGPLTEIPGWRIKFELEREKEDEEEDHNRAPGKQRGQPKLSPGCSRKAS
jgi:hypothetical protein